MQFKNESFLTEEGEGDFGEEDQLGGIQWPQGVAVCYIDDKGIRL